MTCETTKDREAEDLRAQLRTVETSLAGAQGELESLRAEHVEDQGVIAVWRRRTQEAEKRAEDAEHRLDGLREGIMSIVNKCVEMGSIAGEPKRTDDEEVREWQALADPPRRGWDETVDTIEGSAHETGRHRGPVPVRPADTSKPEPDTSVDMSEPTLAGDGFTPGRRYWCKPEGCNHEDSRNPGHPEREGCDETRAAIWEAVQRVSETLGLGPTEREMFKHAIEGASPVESYPLEFSHWSHDEGVAAFTIGGARVEIVALDSAASDIVARLFASERVEIVVRESGELVKKVDAVRKEGLS